MSTNKENGREREYLEKRVYSSMLTIGLNPLHSYFLNDKALEVIQDLMKQLERWGYVTLDSVDCDLDSMRVIRVYGINLKKYKNRVQINKELRKLDHQSIRGVILHGLANRFLDI